MSRKKKSNLVMAMDCQICKGKKITYYGTGKDLKKETCKRCDGKGWVEADFNEWYKYNK